MLEYKLVTIEDKDWVDSIFKECNRRGNEYTFANLFDWSKPMNIKIAKFEDNIIFKHFQKSSVYSCPIGNGNLPEAIRMILKESHDNNEKLQLVNMDEFDAKILEEHFPGQFSISEKRSDFDYIYESSDLSQLAGKKYHGKRNHISKFLKLYPDWRYEAIDENNISTAKKMSEVWYNRALITKEKSIELERQAVNNAFQYYFQMDLTGGILFVGNDPVAYTFGSPSCSDTIVVHAEKALIEYECAYTMVNCEFAKSVASDYKYINREDDMGLEGLRIAKLSYRPSFFYKRFIAREV